MHTVGSQDYVYRGTCTFQPVGGSTYVATGSPHDDVLTGNVSVSGANWPQGRKAGHPAGRHPVGGR